MFRKGLPEDIKLRLNLVGTLQEAAVSTNNLILRIAGQSFECLIGIDDGAIFLIRVAQCHAIDAVIEDCRQNLRDEASVLS
jgi:hypothetical protein